MVALQWSSLFLTLLCVAIAVVTLKANAVLLLATIFLVVFIVATLRLRRRS